MQILQQLAIQGLLPVNASAGRLGASMTGLAREEEDLYRRVAELIEAARSHVARSVNTAMVHAYWHLGRELVEVEQQGKVRADYGERLIANLAQRLSERFGRGMGVATLRRIRRFYLTYPTGTAMPSDVGGLEIRSTPLIESPSLNNSQQR